MRAHSPSEPEPVSPEHSLRRKGAPGAVRRTCRARGAVRLLAALVCLAMPGGWDGGAPVRANPGGDVRGQPPDEQPPPVIESWERGAVDLAPVAPRTHEAVVGPVTGPLVVRTGPNRPAGLKDGRTSRPQGFLWGKTIYLSPGHGWTWDAGSGRWETQRPNSLGIVEDFSNAETQIQFVLPYLWAAGAHVVPVREVDMNARRVVLDDADGDAFPDDGVVQEVGDTALFSDSSLAGYGRFDPPMSGSTNPFTLGGNRLVETAPEVTARVSYVFAVPADGEYNVYVSFSSWSGRASDAHYVVRHPGGEAHFRVDQRHHGGTWVLLGRFWFQAGLDPDRGAVELWNDSADAGAGANISADAVRIGGGLGIIDRGGGTSGFPRYLENSRYHCQYSGAPSSVYETSGDDHSDDVGSRSRFAAWVHESGEDAVYFSFHTNAGGGTGTSIYIYWPNAHGLCDGTDATPGSAELADRILAEIVGDVRAAWDPGWTDRGRRCAWFGELNPNNNGEMPAVLLEAAFHDLPEDVAYLKEPAFRRIVGRAIYQGIVRYFADRDGVAPVFVPEPPRALAARNVGLGQVEVSWQSPVADGVGGDPPTGYRLYQGPNGRAFDEGTDVGETTRVVLDDLAEGEVRFFRVTAVNAGGESLPSRVVGVMASPSGRAPLLLVDGFERADAGLLWAQDTGTYLGTVDRMVLSRMRDDAVLCRHGPEAAAHDVPFDSALGDALPELPLEDYDAVDYVAGRGLSDSRALSSEARDRLASFVAAGGNLLVSGSHVASTLAAGDGLDAAYLADTLHAAAPGGSGGYDVRPSAGEILDGVGEVALHDGEDHGGRQGYDVGPVDVVAPVAPGKAIAEHAGGQGAAAVRSAGPPGAAVLLAFPLEGVVDDGQRREILARILDFFQVRPEVPPADGGADGGDAGGADDSVDAGDATATCRECPCDTGCGCQAAGAADGLPVGLLLGLLAVFLGWRRRQGLRRPG